MAAWRRLILALSVCFSGAAGVSCDSAGAGSAMAGAPATDEPTPEQPEFTTLRIKGETFRLELALDDATRFQGLSGRESIPANGGMLFVFPDVQLRAFVMRDCPNPIDIAYLDGSRRVVAVHTMAPEPPRREGESDIAYERRLPGYTSRFGAQFAIETAGGRLKELGLAPGDQVDFDAETLKARAR